MGYLATTHTHQPDMPEMVNYWGLICHFAGKSGATDDITKKIVAEHFNLEMEYHDEEFERIKILFHERGRKILHLNKDQTLYPKNSKVFVNEIGTASSFLIKEDKTQFFFFDNICDTCF